MPQSVAVLVDGENISAKHSAAILALAATHGEATITRVYLDAQRAGDWGSVVGYRLIHAGTGKNAADILLALDAMELALTKGVRHFVIASSDGDFTHIAQRLREAGAKVVGAGEAKAPPAFRASTTQFVDLGAKPVTTPATKPVVNLVVKPKVVPKAEIKLSQLDINIRDTILKNEEGGSGLKLVTLGNEMLSVHGVRTSSLTEKNWRAYLAARPTLFDLDPRGPEARVRFRESSAIRAA
jgi:hypothetical protein